MWSVRHLAQTLVSAALASITLSVCGCVYSWARGIERGWGACVFPRYKPQRRVPSHATLNLARYSNTSAHRGREWITFSLPALPVLSSTLLFANLPTCFPAIFGHLQQNTPDLRHAEDNGRRVIHAREGMETLFSLILRQEDLALLPL